MDIVPSAISLHSQANSWHRGELWRCPMSSWASQHKVLKPENIYTYSIDTTAGPAALTPKEAEWASEKDPNQHLLHESVTLACGHIHLAPCIPCMQNSWRYNIHLSTSADGCVLLYTMYVGEQGWRSGESAHLPPMCPRFNSRTRCHMWVEFVVGSLLCSKRFFSRYSDFPLSSKPTFLKFQFDPWMHGHFWTRSVNSLVLRG